MTIQARPKGAGRLSRVAKKRAFLGQPMRVHDKAVARLEATKKNISLHPGIGILSPTLHKWYHGITKAAKNTDIPTIANTFVHNGGFAVPKAWRCQCVQARTGMGW